MAVAKTQLWSNVGAGIERTIDSATVSTQPTFRVVGLELGEDEMLAADRHFEARIAKAELAADRLMALQVPAPIASVLWKTAVLPIMAYGTRSESPAWQI